MSEFVLDTADAKLVASFEAVEARPSSDTPFHILILGDFSGRRNREFEASTAELSTWRPRLVDRDNLDSLLSRFGAELHLPVAEDGSLSLTIRFNELGDFHPDSIFERVEIFRALRQTRARLRNPKTFDDAAREVRTWAAIKTSSPASEGPASAPEAPLPAKSSGGLLDQILESTPGTLEAPAKPSAHLSSEIDALVRSAVKPYLVSVDEMEEEQLIAAVDNAVGKQMRAIFHHPDFQALESAWRGVDFLVSRLETGSDLKVFLLDISQTELENDLDSAGDDESTALFKLLVQNTVETPGAQPWSLIAANYSFDVETRKIDLLKRISRIAGMARAPIIAATSARALGFDSFGNMPDWREWRLSDLESNASWNDLTRSAAASYLGLALPRFLLRLPYGNETEPTERFEFEEMAPEVDVRHENYLWGNPSFAIAYLLGKAFSADGWSFRAGDFQEIEGLPLHMTKRDGETETTPCAETLMTVRAAEKIIERGLMPLISMKDTDTVRVGSFQSVAGKRLGGRWNE